MYNYQMENKCYVLYQLVIDQTHFEKSSDVKP